MVRRSGGSRLGMACVTVIALIATVATTHPTASTARPSRVPLNVLLTVSTNLPSTSRQILTTEAERIWRKEGVEIDWKVPGLASESSDAPLRVMVVARPQPTIREQGQWPVAELLPEATPRALAIASITSAQRVVDEATRVAVRQDAPEDYLLGLVLGRAVAHEIGHFLLATGTHAERGLMRARIDAREFAAVHGAAFSLDGDASRWLRERLTSASPFAARGVGGFSYAFRASPAK